MKNHIYHIRLPPLSVTISITHDPYCVMGATPISTLMFPTNKIRFPCDEAMVDATLASFVDFVCFCFFFFFFFFFLGGGGVGGAVLCCCSSTVRQR